MRLKSCSVLAIVLLLTACGAPSATDGVARARARNSGPFGLISPDAVKVATPAAFKGLDRVTIGSFIVGFGTYDTLTGKDGKFGSAARSTLVGVDDATMRRITDDAYASFTKSLRDAGYTLVDPVALQSNAEFAATKSYPNPYLDSSGGIFGDRSTVHYIAPSSFPAMKIYQGDIQGTLGGFAMENPIPASIHYTQATGIKVLHVVYLLNFVNDARSTGLRLNNAAKVGQGMTVAANASKLGVLADMGGLLNNGNGTISLGQPITSDKEFATISDATTSGNLAGQAAANVLTGLMGQGGSQSRDFTFTARPADYVAASRDALDQANTAFIGTMASLR